jgi:hypothetical protein
MDAPSGLVGGEGRQPFEERTNSLCSNKVRWLIRASLLWASRQASIDLKLMSPWDLCLFSAGHRFLVDKETLMQGRKVGAYAVAATALLDPSVPSG